MKGKILLTVFLAALAVLFFDSCRKDPASTSTTQSGAVSDRAYCDYATRTLNSGNAVCSGDYQFSTGRFDIDQSLPYPQTGSYGPLTWTISADGRTLTWSGNVCGLAIIVKGGPNSYTYVYGDGCTSGTGLVSPPTNNRGNTPQISNLTFCWNMCDVECEPGQTAFGGSSAGSPGNGWWYYFDTQGASTQPLWAGQTINAGSIVYDAGADQISVQLGPGWQLQDGPEPVQFYGYLEGALAATRPNPGGGPGGNPNLIYKGTNLILQGNMSRYYVIHVNVQYCE